MITTLADQYLAQNAGRRYPLADDAGYDDIPNDAAILDFRCTVLGIQPGVAPRAWITNVSGSGTKTVTVTVDRPGTNDVLSFVLPSSMAEKSPYVATARDASTGAEGSLTVTRAALSLANGVKNVPLAWTTVVCDSLKVRSLRSAHTDAGARDHSDPPARDPIATLTGDIVLAEGRNAEPYLDGNRIRVDIFKGAGLGENCQSVTSGQTCDNVLFSINGERPGSDGGLRIVGDDGISVTPLPDEHAIEIRMDGVARSRLSEECESACNGG